MRERERGGKDIQKDRMNTDTEIDESEISMQFMRLILSSVQGFIML